ncbi:MAG: flagellar biosynthesis anti-sigma factor FlgM [Spirochaetaceae bacterium]|jgi:negative regulator of flagellin synthesis FlgM|nr:flagellar biosynthesis anti-sigma factor FlgM [Spirochaetaceae bacterium]
MTIDRVGSIDPVPPGKKPGRSNQVSPNEKTDSITFSQEAVEKSGLYQTIELVASAPDVRLDRIEELKAKINDPSYLNDTLIKATADKIMDAFGL